DRHSPVPSRGRDRPRGRSGRGSKGPPPTRSRRDHPPHPRRESFTGDIMKETKQAAASPEARAAMHEMMAAFEAFRAANDARLDEIEAKRSADGLLEEKVARIDQAVAAAQARLDRAMSEQRRPVLESPPSGATRRLPHEGGDESKAAWDGHLRSGDRGGLIEV